MGSCGCGDFAYDEAYKVGKNLMAIQLYSGCGYCGTPVGVVLHLLTPAAAKEWDVEATATFKPDEAYGYADISVPVIHPDDLAAAARSKEFKDVLGDDIDLSEYDTLGDLLEDCGLTLLQIAMDMTLNKWRKEKPATSPEK